jgi:hypothetical protein
MNERIRKLAEQAMIPFKDENLFECYHFSKEKFAELIVNECFRAAMIESKGHINPGELIKRMKERVGVE